MRARRHAGIALAAALSLFSRSCTRPPVVVAHPALFELADADTRIWLFGTIHLLPPDVQWETPAVAAAEKSADTLVTELPGDPPAHLAAIFRARAAAAGLPPLLERVPHGEREAVRKLVERAGLSLATLDAMKSWAAALTLSAAAATADAGATAEDGVEAHIAKRFTGRPRIGLETAESQFAIFDALPEADQRALIIAAARDTGGYRQLLASWERGDVSAIGQAIARSTRSSPAVARTLIDRRNARWAGWIARRMERPGVVFVAVGAGHLAGPGSVIDRLRARGFVVHRMQ